MNGCWVKCRHTLISRSFQIPNLPLEQLMLESSGTWWRFAQRAATGGLIFKSSSSSSSLAPSRNLLSQFHKTHVFIRLGNQTILNYQFQENLLLNSKSSTSRSTRIPLPTRISLLSRFFRTPSITMTLVSVQSPKQNPNNPVPGTLLFTPEFFSFFLFSFFSS